MNHIKQYLDERNMTQGQLAERLGYDLSYVNQIANGRIPITDAFRGRWFVTFGTQAMGYLNGNEAEDGKA